MRPTARSLILAILILAAVEIAAFGGSRQSGGMLLHGLALAAAAVCLWLGCRPGAPAIASDGDKFYADWHRTFDAIPDGIVIFDQNRRLIRANHTAAEMMHLSLAEMVGKTYLELLTQVFGADKIDEVAMASVTLAPLVSGYCDETVTPLSDADGSGVGSLHLLRGFSQVQSTTDQLHRLAYYDNLTGLPNRELLCDQLSDLLTWAATERQQVGVLIIDLDRFKIITDSLGFIQGDHLLQVVSARLRSLVADDMPLARIGSDVFIVVAPQVTTIDQFELLARQIGDEFRQLIEVDGHQLSLTASIGIGIYPQDGETPDTLLKNADIALSYAKKLGGGQFNFYTDTMHDSFDERLRLVSSLRAALPKEQFFLHYQPQFHLGSGRIVGAEALLRWRLPDQGLVAPSHFIPIAEESGEINVIGAWVLRASCEFAQQLRENGHPDFVMAVNLSVRQLLQVDLVEMVKESLQAANLDPAALELEITETSFMLEMERALAILESLRDIGVRIALDDFGSGYSSLNYLKNLPFDKLKIDKAFVDNVHLNPNDASIVDIMVSIGHNFGMTIVAEGVEQQEQLDVLRESGCNLVQGYYISRPLSGDDFLTYLNTANKTSA